MTDTARLAPGDKAPAFTLPDTDGLTFPLLSDPERTVLAACDAYGDKMYGKTVRGVYPRLIHTS